MDDSTHNQQNRMSQKWVPAFAGMTALIWLFLFFPLASYASPPAYLTAMQIQPSPNSTRITFTLSKKVTGKVKYFSNINRIVIEFANTKKRFTIRQAKLVGSNVESISSDDFSENTVRILLDVKEKIRWKTQYVGTKLQLDILSPIIKPAIKPTIKPAVKPIEPKKEVTPAKTVKPVVIKKPRIFTVVIDAGHGGKDTGAIGASGIREKAIVLGVAKKLAAIINRNKNMRAVLTRKGDYYVTLRQRLKLARKGDADLFIAIHADAHYNKSARGVSVFVLSQHGATTEAARWLAQKDTYSELDDLEFNALQDRSKVLRSVLIDLAQTVTIQDSIRLGSSMISAFKPVTRLHYRHVERAPFVVLKSPDIPSILIETGFVSNPKEEKKLSNPAYQQLLAQAIYKGLQQYKGH